MKHAIGIDIGGTKISMILGSAKGKILARRVIPTRTGSEARDCIRDLTVSLRLLLSESLVKKSRFAGIGVGLPGAINSKTGIVPRSPHMKGWEGIPLKKLLAQEFGVPVAVTNDANAAAIGEKLFGHCRGARHFVYMTISTGIGGGLVVNGQLVEGASYVGGEVGHMTIEPEGERCECGKRGCLEAHASGTAIVRFVEREIQRGRKSRILNFILEGGRLSAREVGMAARAGDGLALRAYRWAGRYLGIGIANLLNLLNPEMVVLGGGVLKSAPPVFLAEMRKSCRRDAWPEAFRAVKIVRTKLGDHVGELGALALAFEKKL